MQRLTQLLLTAAVLLMVTGIGLAIAQPGDLGGDDGEQVAQPDTSDTTATSVATTSGLGASTTVPGDASGAADPDATAPTTTTAATTATTSAGSGLGASGGAQSNHTAGGLADTGGESMVIVGLALSGAGLVMRRRMASA